MAKKGYIWYNAHKKKWALGYLWALTAEEALYHTAHELDSWPAAMAKLIEEQVAAG